MCPWKIASATLAIFLPAAILLGGLVAVLYRQSAADEQFLHTRDSERILQLLREVIVREFRSIESDIRFLSEQRELKQFLATQPADPQGIQADYLVFCREKGLYDQVRFIDVAGMEVVRVNRNAGAPRIVPAAELQQKSERYYVQRALELNRGDVFVSPFDLNIEHEQIDQPLKPVIRFATPVFDASGRKRGVVVVNYLGERLLAQLQQLSEGFAGVVMLLNRDGFFLRGRNAAEEWGFMFGNDRTFGESFPTAWRHIKSDNRGQFVDETGLVTFATVQAPLAVPTAAQSPLVARERFEPTSSPTSLPPRSPTISSSNRESVSAAENERQPAAGLDRLFLVTHVPAGALTVRATLLLQRLAVVSSVALSLLLALSVYLARQSVVRKYQERLIVESETRLRTLSTQLLHAQEEERRTIARDLHDALGQLATAISLDLQRAESMEDMPKQRTLIHRANGATSKLIETIHEISTRIRPSLLDDLGMKDAVQSHLAEFETRFGVAVRTDFDFSPEAVTPLIGENVFRILQEALSNVGRHAHADEVYVTIHEVDDTLAISVRDTGCGFSPAEVDTQRLGLLGMRERAELLGGRFELDSYHDQGTEIRATIPLTNARNH